MSEMKQEQQQPEIQWYEVRQKPLIFTVYSRIKMGF